MFLHTVLCAANKGPYIVCVVPYTVSPVTRSDLSAGDFEYTYVEEQEEDLFTAKTGKRSCKKDILRTEIKLIEYPGKAQLLWSYKALGSFILLLPLSFPFVQVGFQRVVLHTPSNTSYHTIYQV